MSSISGNSIDRTTNILYGGSDPENFEDGCLSLGQLFMKRLTQNGDTILLVSDFYMKNSSSLHIKKVFKYVLSCKYFWKFFLTSSLKSKCEYNSPTDWWRNRWKSYQPSTSWPKHSSGAEFAGTRSPTWWCCWSVYTESDGICICVDRIVNVWCHSCST